MRVPGHGQAVFFVVVGGGSNNGVGLFLVEAEFGGIAITSGNESSHSRDLAVPFNGGWNSAGFLKLRGPFEP
jgi:hypothetical protein